MSVELTKSKFVPSSCVRPSVLQLSLYLMRFPWAVRLEVVCLLVFLNLKIKHFLIPKIVFVNIIGLYGSKHFRMLFLLQISAENI